MNRFRQFGPYGYLYHADGTSGLDEVNAERKRLQSLGFTAEQADEIIANNYKIEDTLAKGEIEKNLNKNWGFSSEQDAKDQAAAVSYAEAKKAAAAKEAAKKEHEAKSKGGNANVAAAQQQYAYTTNPANTYTGPKNAAEAQAQASYNSNPANIYTGPKNAAQAQSQAAATSYADATKKHNESVAKAGNADAAAAYSAAARQSSADAAANKARMDWNNSGDQRFAEWKKNYNRMYYQQHKNEWQPGGKYYQQYKYSTSLGSVGSNAANLRYQDPDGNWRLVNGVYEDPETGKLVDLRNADKQTQKAYEEWIKIAKRVKSGGNASLADDRALRKLYEEYTQAERGAKEASEGRAASQHRGSRARDMLTRNANNNVAAGPSFLNELRTSASNFARNTSNAAKKVKQVSANAVSKGKQFISGIRGMLGI